MNENQILKERILFVLALIILTFFFYILPAYFVSIVDKTPFWLALLKYPLYVLYVILIYLLFVVIAWAVAFILNLIQNSLE